MNAQTDGAIAMLNEPQRSRFVEASLFPARAPKGIRRPRALAAARHDHLLRGAPQSITVGAFGKIAHDRALGVF
jgi:hypothetical protein